MSNKLLALLILIGTLSGLFGLYFYFFVGYTSTLTLESNINEFEVELYSKKTGKTFAYTCQNTPCVLSEVSPLSYSLRVRKDGYNSVFQDITMSPRSNQSVRIQAVKQVEFSERIKKDDEISNKDKISALRDKNRARKFFDLGNSSYAYFTQLGILYLYKNSTTQQLGDFQFNETDDLDFQLIAETKYVYFQIGEKKYLYDLDSGIIVLLDLGVDISYIKQGNNSRQLIFVTSVGSYIYDISSNSFDYFYVFKDFVYLEDSYIGVIYTDEIQKIENFDLEASSSNLIIRYNPFTKEKQVLYETTLDIDRIYLQEDVIIFESEGKMYELENL